jgi:pilus assembly protein Flp/PilA
MAQPLLDWRTGCRRVSGGTQSNGGNTHMKFVNALLVDEQGASMAEYAMLLALIAVATIGAVTALRNQIVAIFNSSASTLGSAS